MKKVQLNKEDIKELENIINCLQSEDDETFKLGQSLFETKYPRNLRIQLKDTYISFEEYWNNMIFMRAANQFRNYNYDFSYYFSIDRTVELLKLLVKSEYYVCS